MAEVKGKKKVTKSSANKKVSAKTTKKGTTKKINNAQRVSSRKKAKKKPIISFVTSTNFLLGVFIVLLIAVVVLGSLVIQKNQEEKNEVKANIAIPVCEDNMNSSFSIDSASLKNEGEYVFKIKNYHQDVINEEELEYSIIIQNESGVDIAVTEYENEENLMVDQNATILEGLKLKKGEKEEKLFKVKLLDSTNVEDNKMITITVKS